MQLAVLSVLLLVAAGASTSEETPSPGAIQSNPPASRPASPANGVTPPTVIVPQTCLQSYPPIAIRLNEQGRTVLMVHVTAQGTVTDVNIKNSSGYDALDLAAVKCVQTWTFHPATQNGIPVEANKELAIIWSLIGGNLSPPPIPYFPPHPPAGWEPADATVAVGGLFASYKLSEMPASEQYLSARPYANVSDLGAFVAKIDQGLKDAKGLRVLSEGPTKVCSGDPASAIEFSEPGLVTGEPDRILDVEQIRMVKNSWAYVTTYIRPAESPKRQDAEQWIYAFCGSG